MMTHTLAPLLAVIQTLVHSFGKQILGTNCRANQHPGFDTPESPRSGKRKRTAYHFPREFTDPRQELTMAGQNQPPKVGDFTLIVVAAMAAYYAPDNAFALLVSVLCGVAM